MRFTATPSAKIPTRSSVTGSPASSAARKQAESRGSTPITLIDGFNCLIYTEIPAARPPPPTGTKI